MSMGDRSPMGEPLAILPPTVPRLRTWTEPNRRMMSAMSGSIAANTGATRVKETVAPTA